MRWDGSPRSWTCPAAIPRPLPTASQSHDMHFAALPLCVRRPRRPRPEPGFSLRVTCELQPSPMLTASSTYFRHPDVRLHLCRCSRPRPTLTKPAWGPASNQRSCKSPQMYIRADESNLHMQRATNLERAACEAASRPCCRRSAAVSSDAPPNTALGLGHTSPPLKSP